MGRCGKGASFHIWAQQRRGGGGGWREVDGGGGGEELVSIFGHNNTGAIDDV